ncbi:GNAT family N-acetyltransferase [Isachenkonia alkalipeptolytica]|uniref:GNAT family N-acetyltransferase n=1 Tax=Isachenkonia alkalipeptolytica TaxID=2565777 RepID=A0AA44BEU4_9CLOT|nr:GNAT family protein [Isachenkonia alkalipeptolytica]NBG87896.1 GNAT family N-acetyltransferase [Isachenkonia alkalipeptolytica]
MARYEFDGIETKNLILRRFKESDIKRFYTYRNHPEIRRYKGEGWCDCTFEKAKKFIREQAGAEPQKSNKWFQMAIELKSRGELIGDLGIYISDSDEWKAQIFVTIAPDYQQEGFAEEAATAGLNYAFSNLDVEEMVAIIDTRNQPAVSLLENLAFERQGDFTTNEEVDGEDRTEHLFTLGKEQWIGANI